MARAAEARGVGRGDAVGEGVGGEGVGEGVRSAESAAGSVGWLTSHGTAGGGGGSTACTGCVARERSCRYAGPMHQAFEDMLGHPAPGIWFEAHEVAGVPARLIPTRHVPRPPARSGALEGLRLRLAELPDQGAALLDLYSRHDGVDLCILPCPISGRDEPAMTLPAIAKMEGADEPYRWLHEGLEHIYRPGSYLPVAISPSGGTILNLLLSGELGGRPLAGTIFYMSLDPVIDCTEPMADSYSHLLDWIVKEPAKFLNEIGFCNSVKGVGAEGGVFGDPPDRYVADMLAERARCE